MDNIKEELTKKIGPLPLVAWIGIAGLVMILLSKRGGGAPARAGGGNPQSGTPITPKNAYNSPVTLGAGQSVYDPATNQLYGGSSGSSGSGLTNDQWAQFLAAVRGGGGGGGGGAGGGGGGGAPAPSPWNRPTLEPNPQSTRHADGPYTPGQVNAQPLHHLPPGMPPLPQPVPPISPVVRPPHPPGAIIPGPVGSTPGRH